MIEVTLKFKDPIEVLELVRTLRDRGLAQGVDFDFAYHQSKWDNMIGEIPKHTIFKFYEDKNATLFILQYGNQTVPANPLE